MDQRTGPARPTHLCQHHVLLDEQHNVLGDVDHDACCGRCRLRRRR